METKTITQGRDGCKVSGAYKLIFPIRKDYYHIRNDGTETAYASVFSDSTDTAEDGVYDIPSGGTLCIRSHGSDTLYVSGEVTVMGTASAVCPFKIGLRGGDGYADVTATGNPVIMDGLQGGVPFSEIVVSGDDIVEKELTVNVCGKNLLKYPYIQTTRTSYGVTFTDNGDGSITASGTHDGGTGLSYFGFSPWWADPNGGRLFLPKGNTVTFRVMGLPNTYHCMISVKKDKTSADAITAIYGVGESAANYTAEQDCYIACGIYGLKSSIGQDANFTVYPQLELGDTATPYEPYHGAEYTITPDCNPYTVPNDIRQQDGLNNISVSAGTLSVTGVRKNAAIKRIWEKLDELTTAMIVSNGESE